MKETAPPHLANGIPGAEEFTANKIHMAAKPERIAAIKENTVSKFPSFLRQHQDSLEVNWIMYFKAADAERRSRLTEILLAAGILSLEEFQNLRICDTETQEEFLGPMMLGGKPLFFNHVLPEMALQFKEERAKELRAEGRAVGVSIIQMVQMPVYTLWEKCPITPSA
jgi:hypothetical protein